MAWIYRNQTEWIISLSSDGTTRITISDKNLWATTVYNDGDTLSENNSWYMFQRGNNYWFAITWTIYASDWPINASWYWPWNYYSSSNFYRYNNSSQWDWCLPHNDNLWGDTTDTNEARQWPCDNWFHIPTRDEFYNLINAWITMWAWATNNGSWLLSYLYLPMVWKRDAITSWNSTPSSSWANGFYWTSEPSDSPTYYSKLFQFQSGMVLTSASNYPRASASSIRPFKNDAVIPDRTWTKLYWDDIPEPQTFFKWFIKNWNYYYFGDAPIHISWLALDKSSISLTTVWQTEQLTATISPEWAVETKVVWSSSDETIATVSQTWLVTCVTPWECTITATCGGYSASCSVIQRQDVYADFLLVWGGWWGGWGYCYSWGNASYYWWWWGWAWWAILCTNFCLSAWCYPITIWAWWNWWSWSPSCAWCNWWDSCIWEIIAYWWGGGSMNISTSWCNWWSWGGWWYKCSSTCCYNSPGTWIVWQWYWWWYWYAYFSSSQNRAASWWWGWAWWKWCDAISSYDTWWWWTWIISDISWMNTAYAWGWAWWWCYCAVGWSGVGWLSWYGSSYNWWNATWYWWWGGWWWRNGKWWNWYQWVFILRYPTACWYDISGWTCYTCWDYTIHCFTSNWTLTVN